MCSMIVCVLLPRFELSVAAGGRAELVRGPVGAAPEAGRGAARGGAELGRGPVALAPEPGREPLIGEASAAAEAQGVKAGLRLGEALARCPALRVPPRPPGAGG